MLLLVAATWAAVASLPFLSETWTQLVRARAMTSWVDAFDPARASLVPEREIAARAQRPDEILLRFDEAAGRLQPLGMAATTGGSP